MAASPWIGWLALVACWGALRAAEGEMGAAPAPQESSDLAAAPASQGAARRKKPRVRAACAPELGLLEPGSETARTYALNFQRFCNTSSPWAEKLGLGEVLGFVAPWSDHGYRAARYFRGRLTSLSPLWFRVLPGRGGADGAGAFEIAGWEIAQEQATWSKQASSEFCVGKLCGDGPEVLPHFSLEGFEKLPALRKVLEEPRELAAEIAVTCEKGGFQGIVFDLRLALFPGIKALIPKLTKEIGRALHSAHRRLLLSVPATLPGATRGPAFSASDAAAVAGHVDAIVLGTRDYSRKEPGPSAPIAWMRKSVEGLLRGPEGDSGLRPDQLLLEIPLYGRAFQESSQEGGRVITAGEIAKALAKQRPTVAWDAETAEHSAKLSKGGVWLSLPTLAFAAERLRLASELGVGVALRDLGAGLDAAFDLLPVRAEGTADVEPDATEGETGSEEALEGSVDEEAFGRTGEEL